MSMNIILPIALNLIIVIISIFGMLIGKKNGAIYELCKLFTIVAACIGIYFLTPIIYNLVITIPVINTLLSSNIITESILYSILTVLLFIIVYVLITIVFALVHGHIADKDINTAKPVKVKGINRKETRELRKQQKQLNKMHRKNKESIETRKMASKVFGVIFGCLISLIFSFVLLLPVKPVLHKATENEEIIQSYEYTLFGQLDKYTDVVDKIIQK